MSSLAARKKIVRDASNVPGRGDIRSIGKNTSGRGGLAAKQIPPRPGLAPALGLPAGNDGVLIVSLTQCFGEGYASHGVHVVELLVVRRK